MVLQRNQLFPKHGHYNYGTSFYGKNADNIFTRIICSIFQVYHIKARILFLIISLTVRQAVCHFFFLLHVNEFVLFAGMGSVSSNVTGTTTTDPTTFLPNTTPTLNEREQLKIEFYKTYDVMTGVRIAATLGGFFSLMVLLVVYKSR